MDQKEKPRLVPQTICQSPSYADLSAEDKVRVDDFRRQAFDTFCLGPMNQIPGKVEVLVDKFAEQAIENMQLKRELARMKNESGDDKSGNSLLQERWMESGPRAISGGREE